MLPVNGHLPAKAAEVVAGGEALSTYEPGPQFFVRFFRCITVSVSIVVCNSRVGSPLGDNSSHGVGLWQNKTKEK